MANKKPTLYSLKDIDKVVSKTDVLTCANCKKQHIRKAGRVFICFWCGSGKCL